MPLQPQLPQGLLRLPDGPSFGCFSSLLWPCCTGSDAWDTMAYSVSYGPSILGCFCLQFPPHPQPISQYAAKETLLLCSSCSLKLNPELPPCASLLTAVARPLTCRWLTIHTTMGLQRKRTLLTHVNIPSSQLLNPSVTSHSHNTFVCCHFKNK